MTAKAPTRTRVAVDVGGTFIDYVVLDPDTGRVGIEKQPSTPDQLAAELVAGLQRLECRPADIAQLFHGMTVGVNALVQGRGARVGLITTRGFRDVLEIGRGNRREVYNYLFRAPGPIVERYLRLEVTERLDPAGSVVTPIDLAELDQAVQTLLSRGAESIAIVFLHAYANPAHEIAARERIARAHPRLPVSVSHQIASEWREYERTSTTVLNAFIQPHVKRYLDELSGHLATAGYTRPLAVMQSNGGVCDAPTAADKPVRTLMSGPAGGVIGARFLSETLGIANVICADVGGTTYDVSIIEQGQVLERTEMAIADRPILGSLIDIVSIGAGGGSIAWLDHRNALQVGPQSAGARPGPVCFGLGGTEPTVTDAHLLLGRLDAGNFLGGRMPLDLDGAARAVHERVATPLGISLDQAAAGILAIAETNMANAIRTKTVERGLDPREFVLLSYGGGGGLFAAPVAEELEVPRVVIPMYPANFSAWGILTSDYVEDAARTRVMPFGADTAATVIAAMEELAATSRAAIAAYGFAGDAIDTGYRADIRYQGQEYTLAVPLTGEELTPGTLLARVRERFVAAHRQLYGHGGTDDPLEIVSTRCRSTGRVTAPTLQRWTGGGQAPTPASMRRTRFAGHDGAVDTPVYDRDTLAAGVTLTGPLIVEEWTTTTLVPPGWALTVDEWGNLVLDRQ